MARAKTEEGNKSIEENETGDNTSVTDSHNRHRKKSFEVPDSGRKAITLDKMELKEFKKMSIDFEISEEEVLRLAISLLIKKYRALSPEEININGQKALFE